MAKLYNVERQKIGITLICTLLGLVLPTSFLWVLAAINVLIIGIIHGANDLYIISKYSKTTKKRQFGYLFVSYVFFVSIMVLALYNVPQFALLLFVLASSFHFGEQQWHKNSIVKSAKLHLFYIVYGIFLFSLLFFTHQDQTLSIVQEISGLQIAPQILLYMLIGSAVATVFFVTLNINQLKSQFLFQFLALIVLVLLFTQTSLLWSFSVYFVLWHSIPSLKEQADVLYPDEAKPIYKYFRLALPYWILSLVGFGVAFIFFRENSASLLSLFFGFLAAITIPHVGVIFWMHQKN
ncbi:MAG: beta-carotene 15,15'-dioxygenase, Brp/Blh family [Bacteroidetes bacterium]|nr:beta-carotene 15,15'-dioxygenase, Brp/Blh family [Bacteroidota bacterium]